MPVRYHWVEGTVELAVRARVVNAVQAGWHLAAPNELLVSLRTKRKKRRRMKLEDMFDNVITKLVADSKINVMHGLDKLLFFFL